MDTPTNALQLPGAVAFPAELEERLRGALSAKGPDYRPRTHHLGPGGAPKYINRLILETSPYLLQHAHNPVNWFAWGDEAFELAKALGRPLFLSVGYSTCHWCHVMEEESFEDEEIAAYLNAHFVAIKVDREERPDVDSVYMMAVQLMTGGGGWPMTVVMTPDGKPFFGGTYFPARDGDRGARVGFLTLLKRLKEVYETDRENAVQAAQRLTQTMVMATQREEAEGAPGPDALVQAAQALARRYDPIWGGFGRAPKFPRPSTYELLLRYHRRTGDQTALQMVTHSLDKMIRGGMYDQIGGGFHRYSTDTQWLVPHFEKMLYDNAQLVTLLVETYQVTKEERFAETARETLDYVLREMTSPAGGFYSATDADSEGHEGRFFVWDKTEIERLLSPEQASVVNRYYGVTDRGNFEGRNILHRPEPDQTVANGLGISLEELKRTLAETKKVLYAAREKREHPLLDDKILTEWNAQMISAFARAGLALDEPRYVRAAERSAEFILAELKQDGRLLRAYRNGEAKHRGVLEDYAYLVAALIDLYEATGVKKWLTEAVELHGTMETFFMDEKGGAFFSTPSDGEKLLIREKPVYDGAQPSGNAYAAMNLLRLAELTTKDHYRRAAAKTLSALGGSLSEGALECPKLALALDFFHDDAKEIVVVSPDGVGEEVLLDVIRGTFLPNRVLVVTSEPAVDSLKPLVPLVESKRALKEQPTAYVCISQACKKPTSDPKELQDQLSEVKRLHDAPALQLP